MLPVIEIPLLQQSQCQYHNNFFCHVVYKRIQEHGGSKVFHLSETSVCMWSFSNLSGQLFKNCMLHSCCKSSGPLNDFCSHYVIFFLIELLHIGGAWLFWQNIKFWMEVFQCLQILMMFLLFTQDVVYIIHFI